MFADDSVILSSHSNPVEASERLRKDFIMVAEYFGNIL